MKLTIYALRDGGFNVAEPNPYDQTDLDVFAASTLGEALSYVRRRMDVSAVGGTSLADKLGQYQFHSGQQAMADAADLRQS